MFSFKLRNPWDSAIAVLEDNIFSNDPRRWDSAVVDIEDDVQTLEKPTAGKRLPHHERRKEPRFSISIPVHHRIKGLKNKWKQGHSIDVSQNGIRISIDQPVQVGTRLHLKIKLPNCSHKIKMEGVVVWQKTSLNSKSSWECGVAFENYRKVSRKDKIIGFMANRLCGLALRENHGMSVRPARTQKDLITAYKLVYQEYLMRGYCSEDSSELHYSFYSLLPKSQVFLLEKEGRTIGTISLIADSPFGLPTEGLFTDRVTRYRQQGRHIAEVSLLALDHRFFGRKSFALTDLKKLAGAFLLFKILFDYARKMADITDLFIAMHPRHKELYKYLYFDQIGPIRNYEGAQGKPALPMRLDIPKAVASVPPKLSICHYFVDQATPLETLENSFKMNKKTLDYLLHDGKRIWRRLDSDKQDFLRKCYDFTNDSPNHDMS